MARRRALRGDRAGLYRSIAIQLTRDWATDGSSEVKLVHASTAPVPEGRSRALRTGSLALNVMDATAQRLSVQRQQAPMAELGALLRIVRRNLGSIILTTIMAMAMGIAYLALAKPAYTATSAIFIDPRQRKVVAEDTVQTGGINDIALFESQVSIIGSDTILKRVVQSLALLDDSEFVSTHRPGLLSGIRERISGPRPRAEPMVQAVEALAKSIRVRRAQNTYVVNVDVRSSSPAKAASIANAVLAAYLEDQTSAKSDAVAKANAMIDGRLDELKFQVRQAEVRADNFKRENRLVTSEGGMLNEQQLTKLNTELAAVRSQVASVKAKFDEMQATLKRGVSPEALPEAMTSPVIQRLREQLATAARREAALSSQLQSRHPAMADASAQVASLKTQIGNELQRIATQTQNEYQIAASREREIISTLRGIEGEVAQTTTAQIRLRELEREADAGREILRAFLARAKETQEQQNLQVADARVITPAALPSQPSSPNAPLVMAFATLGGLAAALLRALLAAGLAQPATTGQRLTLEGQMSPLRSIGTLPRLLMRSGRVPGLSRMQDATAVDMMAALTTADRKEDQAFRRSVQSVAGRLRSLERNKGTRQIIMLASGKRGVGVSMTSLSIAFARAIAGDKVLLIDASSTDATLSSLFAGDLVQDEPCVLDNKDHLLALTSRDSKSGLVFLPLALADLNSLTQNQRHRLSNGLAKVVQDFDIVVIDAGAVPDDLGAAALSELVTAAVVVARTGSYDEAEAQDVVSLLGLDPSRVVGVLETMGDPMLAT